MTNATTQARRDAEAAVLRRITEYEGDLARLAALPAPDGDRILRDAITANRAVSVRVATKGLADAIALAARMGLREARCPCGLIAASEVDAAWDAGTHRCYTYGGVPVRECSVCGEDMPAESTDDVHAECAPKPKRIYTPAEVRYWRRAAIYRAMAEILGLIADGTIPTEVRTFSELHDYVDANELGGLCDEGSTIADLASPADDDGACAFANHVQMTVDRWLRNGRPEA